MGDKKKERETFVIAFSVSELGGKEIQLLPFGEVKSKNGTFKVDESSLKSIITAFEAETNDLVVDYEHQTLKGVTAPAAGWIKELVNKGQDGLWARVEWTPKAAEFLKNKEYRYLSPVILLTKDKKAVRLHSAALTNTPAIDGMPVANKLQTENEGENDMEELLKELAAALGLPETATKEEIMAAAKKALQGQAKPEEVAANKEVLELLGLKEGANVEDVKGKIIGLQNPSGYVKVEEFTALKEKLAIKDRDELVALALKEGKIAPAQKAWAEEYALKNPAGFEAFLKDAPVVVPLKEMAGGGAPGHTPPAVDSELQISVNKAFNLGDEEFKKFNV